MADIKQVLSQHWTHSHEEDDSGHLVFRPDGWVFPPSRGRRKLDLRPDGALAGSAPGPTDQRVATSGSWHLLPGNVIELDQDGSKSLLKIVKATADKLVVER